jgi:DNA-binding response OmpR family regulator
MNRILIVEDNPNTREMLQCHLTKAGYEVFEAESGEMALAQIKRDLPDLVLLDVTMPGMSGVEVCHKLYNTPQSELIYIIMVTAVAGIEHRR